MALSGVGDRVEGDRIVFYFGKVHLSVRGARTEVSLGLNGEAITLKPLKQATLANRGPKSYPKIRCKSARGEGDDASYDDKAKVHYGSHRCFEGIIDGDGWCEVTVSSSRE